MRLTSLSKFVEGQNRRGLLVCFAALLMLMLAAVPGQAGDLDVVNAAAWKFGGQLSLAGLLYAQGDQDDKVDQLLSGLKPLAEAMEVEIKPFPPRAATTSETYADVIQYLIKGDGADIGRQLADKFGSDVATLFDVAVKSYLLILLYQPGDDQGIGGVIKSRFTEIGLPENLWVGVVTAIDNKGSQDEVKDAVFKMHDDVAAYLGQQVQ